jgi:hypothetical protein
MYTLMMETIHHHGSLLACTLSVGRTGCRIVADHQLMLWYVLQYVVYTRSQLAITADGCELTFRSRCGRTRLAESYVCLLVTIRFGSAFLLYYEQQQKGLLL